MTLTAVIRGESRGWTKRRTEVGSVRYGALVTPGRRRDFRRFRACVKWGREADVEDALQEAVAAFLTGCPGLILRAASSVDIYRGAGAAGRSRG